MRLPLFIARRYFLSKKSQRAVNVISMISVLGVVVGTAALIIVLSVFNGFEDLILRLYNSFDPDIKIEAVIGKNFPTNSTVLQRLKNDPDVAHVMPVIEENALLRHQNQQFIVNLKGVDSSLGKYAGIDTMIVDGRFELQRGDTDFAVVGSGVAYGLQLAIGPYSPLEVYAPKRDAGSFLHPEDAFEQRYIVPSGIFAIQQEYDSRYVLVPFRFAADIFHYDSLVTALEIFLKPGVDAEDAVDRFTAILGKGFTVKDRMHQHEDIYRIMKSEKWAVFMILTFILIIATFNIIGTLSMLVIEKKKDVVVLHSLGADRTFLRRIFLLEGLFINFIGCMSGMILGLFVCWGQQHYGWIKLSGSGSFVIESYPVQLQALDFLYVFLTVTCIGWVAAWYPARKVVSARLDMRAIRDDE